MIEIPEKCELSLRDMSFICELSRILADWQSLKDAAIEIRAKGFKVKDLSREIKRIASRLGVKSDVLVESIPHRGSRMEKSGRDIALAFSHAIKSFRTEVDPLLDPARTRVALGMTNSLLSDLLPTVLEKVGFLNSFPETDFKIYGDVAEKLQTHLVDRDIDFAVAQDHVPPPGIKKILLVKWQRIFLYKKDKFPGMEPTGKTPEQQEYRLREYLRTVPVLIPFRSVGEDIENWLKKPRQGGRIIKLGHSAIRKEWGLRGLGVAVFHRENNTEELPKGYSCVQLPEKIGVTQMYLYFRFKDERPEPLPPATKCLAEAIANFYGVNLTW